MEAQARPQSKREYFARTISRELGDPDRESLYLQYCKKYPLAVVYRAFAEAKSYPPEKIKKNRPAIFFYLIKRYSNERTQNLGN